MSYDVRFSVKIDGTDKYAVVRVPEHDCPTYNVGEIFRACMDWDFDQGEWDESGRYDKVYYPCDFVIEKLTSGLKEVVQNKAKYKPMEPSNGWGTVSTVITCLENWINELDDLQEQLEVPLEKIYFSW